MQNFLKSALIDVKQLKEVINNQNLRILDCTLPFNKGLFLYKKQRIPNSLFVDVASLCDTSSELTMTFPKADNLRNFLKDLNISKKNHIVCYDQYGIYNSPRIWFILKAFDFPYVSVLNGGFPKWSSSGCEIENELLTDDNLDKNLKKIYCPENAKEIQNEELSLNKNLLAEYEEISDNNKMKNSILIDTRHPLNYKLDNIENSINIPFMSFTNQDQTMKSIEQLKDLLEDYDLDIANDKEIISYCNIGLTACISVFALNGVMGLNNVKLYDGSFEEYSTRNNRNI